MPSANTPPHDIFDEVELLGMLGEATLRLRFQGPFEGRTVTWDATFCTLSACDRQPAPRQNFIEIGAETQQGFALTVGLNVARIDAPTVRKAMMMIRQYKRLARGYHAFGPVLEESREG